ncbi:MAG: hypothetical protein GYA16_11110 [Spirochaetes bacterium]|nr:hypothetical protein [Spirochaetota bacterium]
MLDFILDFIAKLLSYSMKFINWVADILMRLIDYCIRIFRELEIQEKIIILLSIVSVIIPILPIARFYIFESWYYVNNPLAVYFIGIIILMVISTIVQKSWILITRLIIIIYYLAWMIYLPAGNLITRAKPYELAYGYYINIAISIVYIGLCVFSLLSQRR